MQPRAVATDLGGTFLFTISMPEGEPLVSAIDDLHDSGCGG
jgi:hypothetical protein